MKRFIAVFVVCSLLLIGTFASAEEKVELRFPIWSGSPAHFELLNGIASAYTAEHPNVTVKFVTIPHDSFAQKVTIQLAGNNQPDGGWLMERVAPEFINAGVLVDLKATVEKYDYADFSQPVLNLWVRDEAVYGIPFSTSPFVILYNKDLFKQAGVPTPTELTQAGEWTWEKFRELAKTIKEKTGVYAYQTQGYQDPIRVVVPTIRAYGGMAWDRDGNCGFSSPEAVQAVQLFHDMVFEDKSIVPPGEQSDFFAGNAAMYFATVSMVSKLKDVSWKWDLAPLPEGPAGKASVIGQAALVAYSAGKNKEVAADFVAFMTNKENVLKMAKFFPPARISIMESEDFLTANPAVSPESMKTAIADSLKIGRVLPFHENYAKIDLVTRAQFDNLWVKDADVASVLSGVCEAINPLLK